MIRQILVVCEGNVCRSPMAAAFLRSKLEGVSVSSAGLNALVGSPAPEFACDVMRLRGMPIDQHRAQQITDELCRNTELILVMDSDQRRELENRYPFSKGKVYRVGEHGVFDIEDPYRQGRAVFEHCAQTIETGVSEWVKRLGLIASGANARSTYPENRSWT
ncbi:low molecular weight protein-tyrosine-phosphatase [Paraburkholderia aromaticivorans]|uniref:low molecular weight protein-tyrosine-phosphatase n=1 Tax=Paraburkholderia aromaticivorans TaxID=2026199 RepID=UPI0038BD4ED8